MDSYVLQVNVLKILLFSLISTVSPFSVPRQETFSQRYFKADQNQFLRNNGTLYEDRLTMFYYNRSKFRSSQEEL